MSIDKQSRFEKQCLSFDELNSGAKKLKKNDNYEFLNHIKDNLKKAIENNVSFPKISKNISTAFSKKISAFVVKKYCIDNGIYIPKSKKNK